MRIAFLMIACTLFLCCILPTQGQQVRMVTDIVDDLFSSNPSHYSEFENKLYFFSDYKVPQDDIDYYKRDFLVLNSNEAIKIVDTCGVSSFYSGSNKKDWIPFWMGSYYRMNYILYSLNSDLIYLRNEYVYYGENNLSLARCSSDGSIYAIIFDDDAFQSDPTHFAVRSNKFYYIDYSLSSWEKKQVWVYNAGSTPKVEESLKDNEFQNISEPVYFNGKYYFIVTDLERYGYIMSWDGLNNAVTETSIGEYNFDYDKLYKPFIFNTKLYFSFRDNVTGKGWMQLWCFDFINAPIKITSASHNGEIELIGFNNKLYYINTITGYLMEYDGEANLKTVASVKNSTENWSEDFLFRFSHMFVFNDTLFFSGYDEITGTELYVFDGINEPKLFADINPGQESSYPANFYEYNNKLYYSANDGVHGNELWVYDPGITSSIETKEENHIKVYPNPTSQILNIQIPKHKFQSTNLKINSLTGQQILTQTISAPNHTIDVSNLAKGYYIISVSNDKYQIIGTEHFVKY